jgi:alpha-glucosidase
MSKLSSAAVCGLVSMLACAFSQPAGAAPAGICVDSPRKVLTFCVNADGNGAWYDVYRTTSGGQTAIITHARLGLVLAGFGNAPATQVGAARRNSVNASWEQPWGEQRVIRDVHNELSVTLSGKDAALTEPYDLTARVFDDGVGFRYEFRSIAAGRDVAVTDELTEFLLSDAQGAPAFDAWWYPARHVDRDEYLYQRSPLYLVNLAETPLTLQSSTLYLSIHEAALVDYASMNLRRTAERTLKADLMPWSDGVLVRKRGPFITPWRTILIATSPAELADSRLGLNLNEPNKLGDTSWVSLGKYVGIWWEMHLNHSTWASGAKHGANDTNVKRYIDFAAKYRFGGVLVEGWNQGWDGDWIANGKHFSFTEPYADFDLPMLSAYAKERGVRIIGHNETAGAVENYERQLEAAMALYARNNVAVVKTGYVRPSGSLERTLADGGVGHEWFAGQFRVRHELEVAETAARHHISIVAHEPVKDTGLRRTWPNMLSREGARGQEFNAWGRPTNPPEHLSILPFTRMLAGPMDFTPGIFDLTFGKDRLEERVQSTLATQLAEYVVLYSPVQMAADLPENYEKRRDAFQFILDVPTDWETSRTLAGEIGDYVVVARQQRGGRDWYLGAVTDENARRLSVPLDFLASGKRYEAQIYRDADDADYRGNPAALVIDKHVVTAKDALDVAMAPGGGIAVRFRAL